MHRATMHDGNELPPPCHTAYEQAASSPCRHPGRAQRTPAPEAGAPCVVGSSLINTSAGPRGCTRLPCIPAKEGLLLRCGQSDVIARTMLLQPSTPARAPESWYCITPAGSRDRTGLLVHGDIAASSGSGTSTPRVVPRSRPCSRSRL